MYGFGQLPSQFNPMSSNVYGMGNILNNLTIPSDRRVENDIRTTYDKIYKNQDSHFGYSRFGQDDDDYEETRYLNFGYPGYDSGDDTDDDADNYPGPPGSVPSEFGKKQSAAVRRNQKNAARAMRLARREDISLKEAWAIVKGDKKPRKSKSRKTTKKRKTAKRKTAKRKTTRRKKNSDASRAMKLAHREGISLKQAWKRVKRS